MNLKLQLPQLITDVPLCLNSCRKYRIIEFQYDASSWCVLFFIHFGIFCVPGRDHDPSVQLVPFSSVYLHASIDTSLGYTKRNVHLQVKRDDRELLSLKATQFSR